MIEKPFKDIPFLDEFEFDRAKLKFTDQDFFELDNLLRDAVVFESPAIEQFLMAQTEFLSTFSTAKAEEVNELSADEARKMLDRLLGTDKVNAYAAAGGHSTYKRKLDVLEYTNIVRAFRETSEKDAISLKNLSIDTLRQLHIVLTEGLDDLQRLVGGDSPDYRPGQWRESTVYIGGIFPPAPAPVREALVRAPIDYYNNHKSIADCFLMSMSLYAVHPFQNGNKRVCRILEHGLLRTLGLNKANIYSHITETYFNLDRYKTAIAAVMRQKVLNHFVSMQMESLFWAQMQSLRAAVEYKRREFVDRAIVAAPDKRHLSTVLPAFVENRTLQFKEVKEAMGGANDKIVADLMTWCLKRNLLEKHPSAGREVYYRLPVSDKLEAEAFRIYKKHKDHVTYIPKKFNKSMLFHIELAVHITLDGVT